MGDQARVRSVREGQDLPLDFVILGQCTSSFGYMASITHTSSRVIDDGSPLSLRVLDQITAHLRVPLSPSILRRLTSSHPSPSRLAIRLERRTARRVRASVAG